MAETQQYGETAEVQENAPAWQPLSAMERRIVGVLIEKAKTTPDSYPLSLNGLTTGCNQKSNRFPQMNLNSDDVEETIEGLRIKGTLGVIQGGGRVVKYRHYMKEWLGVDGSELGVMAELLLRGPQTLGELRGRAARMAPIADLGALRPVLESLTEKRLVVALTPEGRGQIITHGLYADNELERLRREHGGNSPQPAPASATPTYLANPAPSPPSTPTRSPSATPARTSNQSEPSVAANQGVAANPGVTPNQDVAALRDELRELTGEVARLRKEVEDLWENIGS